MQLIRANATRLVFVRGIASTPAIRITGHNMRAGR
jgi:hypothetical protein